MAYRCQASSVGVRLKSLILATSLCLTLLFGGVANAGTRQQSGPCINSQPIKPSLGGPVVERRVRHLIACSTKRWPVSGGTPMALCIAHRESGPYMWPWADSGSSKGTFQQNSAYWPDRARTFWERRWLPAAWPPNYFNPRQNVIVSIRMAHSGGWGPWGNSC